MKILYSRLQWASLLIRLVVLVTWLPTGALLDQLSIKGDHIQDLEIERDQPTASVLSTKLIAEAPVDPAILSFAKPPKPAQSSSVSQLSAHSPQPQAGGSFSVSPLISDLHLHNHGGQMAAATLTEPFSDLSLNGNVSSEAPQEPYRVILSTITNEANLGGQEPTKRGARKRGPRKTSVKTVEDPPTGLRGPTSNPLRSGHERLQQSKVVQSHHVPLQRQAVADPNASNAASIYGQYLAAPSKWHGKRPRHKPKHSEAYDQNGWQTEEATDIQDMGDFDFEGNLSKFDKRKVFEQIRQEDTTADEARLVSFNRTVPRPGTYGGKNLHFTENVLDSPPPKHLITSSSESDVDIREARMSSSRNSHRNPSRTAARRAPSRKGSGVANNEVQAPSTALLQDLAEDGLNRRSRTALVDPIIHSSFSNKSSKGSSQRLNRSLRTVSSSRECPCLSPLQMIELEQLVISRFGLNEDMLTENAATTIAQTARKLCSAPDDKNSDRDSPSRPFIVILAANHKTASRVIAAARHLRNHSAQVVLCILGLEREGDLLDDVRRQLNIFRSGGGKAIRPDQLMQRLRGSSTNLIVDAMFGMHFTFHDLRVEDQIAYLQLLRWSNSMNATKLSIDIPSGVDASSGKNKNFSTPLSL